MTRGSDPVADTKRRQQIVDFIVTYHGEHDHPPTVREIATHCGLASTISTVHHLRELVRQGVIRTEFGKVRTIQIIGGKPSE